MRLLFYSTLDDPAEWLPVLRAQIPGIEIEVWPEVADPAAVDVALIWTPPPDGLDRYPNLKAVLSLGAGVNQLDLASLPQGVPVARLVDPSLTDGMRDYCVWAVMRYHRYLDEHAANQVQHRWVYKMSAPKSSVRVGVLGLGELGATVARALAEVGFQTRGWARSRKAIEGVRCFAGAEELAAFAAETEILICLLPLTPETRGILSRHLFQMLPSGARIINVGRGDHLVEGDLLAALGSGHVAAATLDVFSREPLPADHAFWSHPKITVTPHVATWGSAATAVPHVAENIRRAMTGQRLLNQVDIKRGY
jgi:glyoxylate/hydroxypyruvate reductase A